MVGTRALEPRVLILPQYIGKPITHAGSEKTSYLLNANHQTSTTLPKMSAPMSQSTQPALNPTVTAEGHPQPSQAQTELDPVAKVKMILLPRLKDSLVVSWFLQVSRVFVSIFPADFLLAKSTLMINLLVPSVPRISKGNQVISNSLNVLICYKTVA